jgi:hypothetical protein
MEQLGSQQGAVFTHSLRRSKARRGNNSSPMHQALVLPPTLWLQLTGTMALHTLTHTVLPPLMHQ